jgi:ornithine carbamoyltransferase
MKRNTTLQGKSILTMTQLVTEEITYLVNLAEQLKNKKKRGICGNLLKRKNIAVIFEKSSIRTRCAFTIAAADEGAHTEYLNVGDIHSENLLLFGCGLASNVVTGGETANEATTSAYEMR